MLVLPDSYRRRGSGLPGILWREWDKKLGDRPGPEYRAVRGGYPSFLIN